MRLACIKTGVGRHHLVRFRPEADRNHSSEDQGRARFGTEAGWWHTGRMCLEFATGLGIGFSNNTVWLASGVGLLGDGLNELGLELRWFMPARRRRVWQDLQRAGITQRHLVIADPRFYRDHWAWVRVRIGFRQTLIGKESYGQVKKDQLRKVAAAEPDWIGLSMKLKFISIL